MNADLSPERWRKISALIDEALDLPVEARSGFLDRACSADPGLRTELEALLRADREAGPFLEQPAGAQAVTLLKEMLELEDREAASMVGQAVGSWRLVRRLGQGGMGVVYLAERIGGEFKQNVALKLIKHGMDSKEIVARFEAERQALGLMDHPTIAKIYDAGTTPDGRPYFAMEYVEGIPITEHCDRHELTTRERLDLFVQVCEGVQHAHQKAVIHRDLKPSNVLVGVQDGRPAAKIIDFGVAKALAGRLAGRTFFTELGMMIGTPEYMSPEQAGMTGQDVDTRSDVYSLGVMLYELLVGALPFEPRELRQAGFDEIRRRIREEDPPRPSVRLATLGARSTESAKRRRSEPHSLRRQIRGDLDWITMRALEKDPARRYGSPSDLAQDIRAHLRNEPLLAHAPSTAYRARKFVRRHRLGVAAAAVMAAGLAAGAVGATVGMVRARRAEARALQEAQAKGQVAAFLKNLFKVSNPTESRGNSITARELLDRATGTIDEQLAQQPEVRADLVEIMGEAYRGLGLNAPALSLSQKVLDIRKRVLGPEHIATLKAMNNLAVTLQRAGQFPEAERVLTETLAIRMRVLGREHPDTLASQINLAALYGDQRRLPEAERILLETLPVHRRVLGPEHENTVVVMASLATMYYREGRNADAEGYARDALAIWRRTLGQDHPRTLAAMGTLALVVEAEGRFPEAESLLLEALAVKRRVLGPEHPGTLITMDGLAGVYLSEGRFPESERLYRDVLAGRERVLGATHQDTLNTMYNLGCLAAVRGDRAAAMDWIRRAVEGGYMSADAMVRDHDLAVLHGPAFDALVERARRNAAAARASAANPPKN